LGRNSVLLFYCKGAASANAGMRRSAVAISAPTGAHVGWKFETLQLFPQK
jgi:hypothetical protein